jgi:hypothetical protein
MQECKHMPYKHPNTLHRPLLSLTLPSPSPDLVEKMIPSDIFLSEQLSVPTITHPPHQLPSRGRFLLDSPT